MKLKKLLPVILLALLLIWLFLPTGDARDAAPAPTVQITEKTGSAPPLALLPSEAPEDTPEDAAPPEDETPAIDEDGVYTTRDDVALYIHTYGRLPSNFVTKKEAEAAGWSGGSLEPYLPGKCIGGSHFGNYEGLLPKAKGRTWTECDINTLGKRSRGSERIIFSNDGLIFYTDDHYESFIQLY